MPEARRISRDSSADGCICIALAADNAASFTSSMSPLRIPSSARWLAGKAVRVLACCRNPAVSPSIVAMRRAEFCAVTVVPHHPEHIGNLPVLLARADDRGDPLKKRVACFCRAISRYQEMESSAAPVSSAVWNHGSPE